MTGVFIDRSTKRSIEPESRVVGRGHHVGERVGRPLDDDQIAAVSGAARAAGTENLPDHELLEVILFAARARGEVKPVAKALLAHFGGLAAVISAEPEALAAAGLNLAGIAAIKAAREVVKRALELGAAALILVHNHLSGDPTPSKADIAVTQDIKKAAAPLGLVLHDHLIIGRTSLRDLKLIWATLLSGGCSASTTRRVRTAPRRVAPALRF